MLLSGLSQVCLQEVEPFLHGQSSMPVSKLTAAFDASAPPQASSAWPDSRCAPPRAFEIGDLSPAAQGWFCFVK